MCVPAGMVHSFTCSPCLDSLFSFPPPLHSRMYAALCRLQKDIEQVQFIACELLLKSMASNNLPTVIALASIWPYAFARNLTAPLVHIGDQFKTEGCVAM